MTFLALLPGNGGAPAGPDPYRQSIRQPFPMTPTAATTFRDHVLTRSLAMNLMNESLDRVHHLRHEDDLRAARQYRLVAALRAKRRAERATARANHLRSLAGL